MVNLSVPPVCKWGNHSDQYVSVAYPHSYCKGPLSPRYDKWAAFTIRTEPHNTQSASVLLLSKRRLEEVKSEVCKLACPLESPGELRQLLMPALPYRLV